MMITIRILTVILLLCVSIVSTFAQIPEQYIVKMTLNTEHLRIWGLPADEFDEYYSEFDGAHGYSNYHAKSTGYSKLVLKRFLGVFEDSFNEQAMLASAYSNMNNSITGVLVIEEITDHAGIRGHLVLSKDGDTQFMYIDLTHPEGRWNKFEALLVENAKTAGLEARTQFNIKLNNDSVGQLDNKVQSRKKRKLYKR